jgi:exosome complex component RRP45
MRPPSPSIPERDFTIEAFRQNLRVDGRELLEMRPVTIDFGEELGWVECSMGDTRYVRINIPTVCNKLELMFIHDFVSNLSVLAQVDAKMVKPPPERPLEGLITINSEISPMASSDYEPGR